MIIVKKDAGEIQAVLEYYLVNRDGSMNDKGKYVWIQDADTSKSAKGNGVMKYFIKELVKRCPHAEYGYYRRGKYGNRIKMFSRRIWESKIGGDN